MPISVKAHGREHPLKGTERRFIYPWKALSVGDWFFAPTDTDRHYKNGSVRNENSVQGKIAQLIRWRNRDGDRHQYMHYRADQKGKSGIIVKRVK